MRQTLVEFIEPHKRPLIAEKDADGKSLYLVGKIMSGDEKNLNGRIYPRSEITKAITELTSRIDEQNGIPGSLDHPDDLTISLQTTSHVIKRVWMEGSDGYGKLRILEAGMGLIVKSLVEAEMLLGVSTRGSGSVNESTGKVSDFSIVTADIVSNPSGKGCIPTPVFEHLDRFRIGKEVQYLSQIQEDKQVQKHFKKAIYQFLTEIRDEVVWKK